MEILRSPNIGRKEGEVRVGIRRYRITYQKREANREGKTAFWLGSQIRSPVHLQMGEKFEGVDLRKTALPSDQNVQLSMAE